jgi:hypothetical protein
MPCPECGGTDCKPLAPGYWQCTTMVDDPAFPRSAWDEADPWRAATHPRRPCGHRYQDGSPYRRPPVTAKAETERKREAAERVAVQRAVDALAGSGRRPGLLATIEHVNTPRGPGGGSINWYLVKEKMGQGWYVGQLEWKSTDHGPATSTRLVLSEDGRLLEGAGYVGPKIRPGRYFSVFRSEVIAVEGSEFDIAHCGSDSLEDLTTGLFEIAAGNPKSSSWARLP